MAFVIKDRVRETTATTGTGTVTLAGAVSGYQAFSAIGNGNTTYYCIAGQGTNEWEVGIGTYTSAGTTLSRTTVLSSSNSGSLVPFSAGTKDVFVTQPASRAVFQDDLLDASTGNNFNAVSYNGGQLAGFRNKLINGAMEVAQRGTSFIQNTGIQASCTLDRFARSALSTGQLSVTQELDGPASDLTLPSGNYYCIAQYIEGYQARPFLNNTFTYSFWVRSAKTGTHCVAFVNSGNDRSYVTEYTVNAANTWEYKTVTVSGGLISAGTWDWLNGVGVRVLFTLNAGSTYQTTANNWQTGQYYATSSQVNVLDTNGNIFSITGAQLEIGSVVTPFETRMYPTELLLCQRYYQIYGKYNTLSTFFSYRAAGDPSIPQTFYYPFQFVTTVRTTSPTCTMSGQWTTVNVASFNIASGANAGDSGARITINTTTTGLFELTANIGGGPADGARIIVDAELT